MTVILAGIALLGLVIGLVAGIVAIASPKIRMGASLIACFGLMATAAAVSIFLLTVSLMN